MSDSQNPLIGETLLTLDDAAKDFGGVTIPYNTLKLYAYQGVGGVKLETVYINKRYTSKEAILRFIDRRQSHKQKPEKPKVPKLTQRQVDTGLRRHGIVR
jgi:hypothetical protein